MAIESTSSKQDVRSLNLYQKLAAITGEVGAIAKGGNNTEQNFKFIEYAAVAGRLRELFAKYGVVVVPRMQPSKQQMRSTITSKYGKEGVWALIDMSFTVINADAPDDKFTATWTGEAMEYGDKAANKAATGALKYFLMRMFNVSEQGDDPDAHSPEAEPSQKPSRQKVADAPVAATTGPTKAQVDTIYRLGAMAEVDDETLRATVAKLKKPSDADVAIKRLEERIVAQQEEQEALERVGEEAQS